MSLLTIFLVIIITGVVLYLVNAYVPMDGKFKRILNIVAIIFLIVWLLKALGAFAFLASIHI